MAGSGVVQRLRSSGPVFVLFLLVTVVYAIDIGSGSVYNGDPAQYAEAVRQMLTTGDLLDARWHDTVLHQRPPLSLWLMTLSASLFGEGELALRLPAAVAGGATVAGVYALGRRVLGELAAASPPRWAVELGALTAALSLFGMAQHTQFARTATSDLPLTALIVWSIYAYVRAIEAPRWHVAFGVLLGAAMLTKQIVGMLPLGAPLAHALSHHRRPLRWRWLALAGAGALAVLLPWYLRQSVVYGGAFWSEHLGYNVASRAGGAVLERTGPLFYFEVLWRKEWPLALPLGGGIVALALAAVRRRVFAALLVGGWAVAVLAVFSVAGSRFDYYLLVGYPAFALAIGGLVVLGLGWAPTRALRCAVVGAAGALVVANVVFSGLPRIARRLDAAPAMKRLAEHMRRVSRPGDPLLVWYRPPLAARYYAQRRTYHYARNRREAAVLGRIPLWGKTGSLRFVPTRRLERHLAAIPRFFVIVAKRDLRVLRVKRVVGLRDGVYLLGRLPLYLVRHHGPLMLLTNLRRPGP